MAILPYPPKALCDSMASLPNNYVGYTTCGSFVNTCTTASAPNWNELAETVRKFRAEQERIDAGLIEGLNKHIAQSGESLAVWAERLWVHFEDLVETLAGRRAVSAYFWDQVRRVFINPTPSA